jgi:hypothetical protein
VNIDLRHLCDLHVELAAPIELGTGPRGRRRIIPIVGGIVTGERLSGRILDLGADWQTVFSDHSAELDTRYAIETMTARPSTFAISAFVTDRGGHRGSGARGDGRSEPLLHAHPSPLRDGRCALRVAQPDDLRRHGLAPARHVEDHNLRGSMTVQRQANSTGTPARAGSKEPVRLLVDEIPEMDDIVGYKLRRAHLACSRTSSKASPS